MEALHLCLVMPETIVVLDFHGRKGSYTLRLATEHMVTLGHPFLEIIDHAYIIEAIHHEAYGGSNKALIDKVISSSINLWLIFIGLESSTADPTRQASLGFFKNY